MFQNIYKRYENSNDCIIKISWRRLKATPRMLNKITKNIINYM